MNVYSFVSASTPLTEGNFYLPALHLIKYPMRLAKIPLITKPLQTDKEYL